MLPHEKVEFLLTCIRSPYVEENINLTFEYLNQIKSLRTKRYQLRGLRRPISPAAQTAQQPDQAADRERSRVTLDDIMAELGGIKVTMGSDRTEFSNTVGQLSNTVGQLSNTVGQLSVSIGQLSATVAHLSIESIQTNAKLQTLQANFEKHLREEHRQPMAVTPPRISPPPQDSPIGAAPAIQLPEEDNRRSESARESTGTDQSSNSPRVSSQDDFPDVTFASSSASPEIEIPDSDESSSAAPASPAPRDSSESSANTRRSMYILRSRCNVSDDVVKKFPKDIQVGGSRPAVISSGSSSGDDDHDASKIRKMLSILKLNDPQQPRIIISSTLSFAVDDADLYANTNFAEYIAWVGKLTSKWQCTVCNKTFETYAIPAHVWLVHIRGSFKCEAEGCNFVGHSVSTMRGHLKRH
ncbi:uncharacterized protein LOC130675491 [Microplitis mediator]|uniref:uncharacterized protein LOC130675491 n=1 Tax=Microplitis mediator TaxID=375433 RepID=UPI002556CEBB|nr:uncharacterized protein LOC130675491 [Microplitis mediator]